MKSEFLGDQGASDRWRRSARGDRQPPVPGGFSHTRQRRVKRPGQVESAGPLCVYVAADRQRLRCTHNVGCPSAED